MFDIQFIDLGLMDYETAEKIQNEAFEEAIQNSLNQKENTLKAFIVEHHPVYTLGKNGNMNHVLPLAKQSGAQIYFMYAHDYNTGYVGRTNNIKSRCYSHHSRGQVNHFANQTNTVVKSTFEIHQIYACDSSNASEHEARVLVN
jgi:predicted GIY-YIG superfamily endonuclease